MARNYTRFDELPLTTLSKIPRQQRSINKVHDILNTAGNLIDAHGVVALTTNDIAEQGNIAIGTIYQYFANKEMIIAGLVERALMEHERNVRQLIRQRMDGDPKVIFKMGIIATTTVLKPHQNLVAEIFSGMPLFSNAALISRIETRFTDVVQDWLNANNHRLRLRGGRASIWMAVNACAFLYLKWLSEQPDHVSTEQFADTLVEMFIGLVEPAAD